MEEIKVLSTISYNTEQYLHDKKSVQFSCTLNYVVAIQFLGSKIYICLSLLPDVFIRVKVNLRLFVSTSRLLFTVAFNRISNDAFRISYACVFHIVSESADIVYSVDKLRIVV